MVCVVTRRQDGNEHARTHVSKQASFDNKQFCAQYSTLGCVWRFNLIHQTLKHQSIVFKKSGGRQTNIKCAKNKSSSSGRKQQQQKTQRNFGDSVYRTPFWWTWCEAPATGVPGWRRARSRRTGSPVNNRQNANTKLHEGGVHMRTNEPTSMFRENRPLSSVDACKARLCCSRVSLRRYPNLPGANRHHPTSVNAGVSAGLRRKPRERTIVAGYKEKRLPPSHRCAILPIWWFTQLITT